MSGPEKESAFRPKARRPRGFQDRRGPALAAERDLVEKISKVYESWGFERLETPAFEYADALGKFLPDQDRPNEGVFALEDDDSQWMALRYDLTAPLARFVAENFDALPKPYRRWAAGPVWRNEKPGPGRYREFWQCDADTVGSASPAADAEMIAMACAALEAVGIERGKYCINVSDRRVLDSAIDLCLQQAAWPGAREPIAAGRRLKILRAIDKWDRLGNEGVRALLGEGRKDESGDFTPGAGLPDEAAFQLMNVLSNPATSSTDRSNEAKIEFLKKNLEDAPLAMSAVADLQRMNETLQALSISDRQWRVNTSVVRGLEYYTGAIYEAELLIETTDETGGRIRFGSVGGGGRYDDLVARFTGQLVPATGFSVGVSRLAAALEAVKQGEASAQAPVVVLALDQARMGEYFAMAAELRNAGVRAEVYLGQGGMRAQMKYADKRGAPIAIIQGGDEIAKGVVTLKDLKLGAELSKEIADNVEWRKGRPAQIETPRAELVSAARHMLAQQGARDA
jgi:histidyl-tRNA synthetase